MMDYGFKPNSRWVPRAEGERVRQRLSEFKPLTLEWSEKKYPIWASILIWLASGAVFWVVLGLFVLAVVVAYKGVVSWH